MGVSPLCPSRGFDFAIAVSTGLLLAFYCVRQSGDLHPSLPGAFTCQTFDGSKLFRSGSLFLGLSLALLRPFCRLPVSDTLQHACGSYNTCIDGLLKLALAPEALVAEVCGTDRVINLPSFSATLKDLGDAMHRVAATDPRFKNRTLGKIDGSQTDERLNKIGMVVATTGPPPTIHPTHPTQHHPADILCVMGLGPTSKY